MESYQNVITKLVAKENLAKEDVQALFSDILSGKVEDVHIAAVLTAWAVKGPEHDELLGLAQTVLDFAEDFSAPDTGALLDVVGTGGDTADTFNVSTVSAVVCAAAGAQVLKHGNRAATSKCGSFDFLEHAGIFSEKDGVVAPQKMLEEKGIGFAYAPHFHPSLKHVGPIRKMLGFPTIFNILGPLVNPAQPQNIMIGVARKEFAPLIGSVAHAMGAKRVVVVHGAGAIDEVSIMGPTHITEFIESSQPHEYEISTEDLIIGKHDLSTLAGGDAARNIDIAEAVFAMTATGPQTDFVLANSGVALYAAGLSETPKDGVQLARETLESGKAQELWNNLKKKA